MAAVSIGPPELKGSVVTGGIHQVAPIMGSVRVLFEIGIFGNPLACSIFWVNGPKIGIASHIGFRDKSSRVAPRYAIKGGARFGNQLRLFRLDKRNKPNRGDPFRLNCG